MFDNALCEDFDTELPVKTGPLAHLRVMVADDEPDILETLSLILSSKVDMLISAPDGEAAINNFRSLKPHIVIADIMMPKKDGITMASEMKAMNCNTEIVFISGNLDGEAQLPYGTPCNNTHYIAKPFNARDIIDKLSNIACEKFSNLQ